MFKNLAYNGNTGRLEFSHSGRPKPRPMTRYMDSSEIPLFLTKYVTFAVASNQKELVQLMTSTANLVYDKKNQKIYDNFNLTEQGWHTSHELERGSVSYGRQTVGSIKNPSTDSNVIMSINNNFKLSGGIIDYQESSNNTESIDKKIRSLESKFQSLEKSLEKNISSKKFRKDIKGEVGATGKQGERGLKGEVGATGKQGERGLKGDSGSASVDTDIITGINKKISSLEKAVELDQKLPSSNSNNINYYINRNYEDIKSNSTQFSSVFSRLAASELLIEDLTSVIGTLTGKIEALELGLG